MKDTPIYDISVIVTQVIKEMKGASGNDIITEILNRLEGIITADQLQAWLLELGARRGIPFRDLGFLVEHLSITVQDNATTPKWAIIASEIALAAFVVLEKVVPKWIVILAQISGAYFKMKGGKDAHII